MGNKENIQLFVSAGEVSGDKILSQVLSKLLPQLDSYTLFGLGGEESKKQGLKSLASLKQVSASGIWDIWANLPIYIKIINQWKKSLKACALNKKSKALAILVDFPGLNKKLLKICQTYAIPVYYISPSQTWPYRHKKILAFKNCPVQVLYPMDLKAYTELGTDVSYGHFQNFYLTGSTNKEAQNPESSKNYLLCPGSRLPVIKRNLIKYCKLLEKYIESLDAHKNTLNINEYNIFVLTTTDLKENLQNHISGLNLPSGFNKQLRVTTEPLHDLPPIQLALCYPGTMNLELALFNIPHLLCAFVDPMTFYLGKKILKPDCLSLANGILSEKYFLEWAGIRIGPSDFIFLLDLMHKAQSQPGKSAEIMGKLGPSLGADLACKKCLQFLHKSQDSPDF